MRSDAERNKSSVLAAAAELVAANGPGALRVADVASLAGVGPGTVYRAYSSRSGLLLALLDEEERTLQEEAIRGAPPLGPGAPARERAIAFVTALHELSVRQREILTAADAGSQNAARSSAAHRAWTLHLDLLLREIDPEHDSSVLAELILAWVAAPLQTYLIDHLDKPATTVRDEVARLLAGLLPNPPPSSPSAAS